VNFGRLTVFVVGSGLCVICTAQPQVFIFSRPEIAAGQWWRLFSGHFVHFSPEHLVANLLVFSLLLLFWKPTSRRDWLGLTVLTPILLSASLFVLRPKLVAYGGLSGWLSAFFVWIAASTLRKRDHNAPLFQIATLIFIVKLIFESSSGASLTAFPSGVRVEPAAHLLGACLGLIGGLVGAIKDCEFNMLRPNVRNKKAVPEGTA
jgi:rhomboid family GlyGly-CTERM serine protease